MSDKVSIPIEAGLMKKFLSGKQFTFIILILAAFFVSVIIAISIPVWRNLQALRLHLKEEQVKLDQVRQSLPVPDKIIKKFITSADDIPLALNELAKKANFAGIKFDSLKQKETIALGAGYKILPLDLETVCDVQALANFLGALDNLRNSVMVVNRLEIKRDKELLPQVKATMELGMYLAF
jgi:Tfp pilus assembly protein PilO